MTNQQMISAILSSIQDDAKLMTLLRLIIANNIRNIVPADDSPSPQLIAACQALGIPTS